MPWRNSSPMDLRTQFIADYLRELATISELCRQYQISRKTAYKWIDRYSVEGASGLQDRSRRPHHSPQETAKDKVQQLLEARRRHPTWGAKKLLTLVAGPKPDKEWPARSTVCDILARHNLVPAPRRRRAVGHPGKPSTIVTAPNEVWAADFKGQFKTRDGYYCYPLTVTDWHSRFLLGCQALASTATADAKSVFRRLFQEFGLPERIRTDNGVPFACVALARLSSLSVWFIRLGIRPELIELGKPQQNGRHERMHRTLKAETRGPQQEIEQRSNAFLIPGVRNSITCGHTKHSPWKLRPNIINLRRDHTQSACRSLSMPAISRHAALATMVAFAGARIEFTSASVARTNMSGSKK